MEAFEREAASWLGVKHVVGLNSGTDALVIALRALGVGPGDEVITTPFSFFATAEAISNVGAMPVFVDVDEQTMNLDVAAVEAALTPRTKAIMPVHLFGRPVDMDVLLGAAARVGVPVRGRLRAVLRRDVARAAGRHHGHYRSVFVLSRPKTSARSATPGCSSPTTMPSRTRRGCCGRTAAERSTTTRCSATTPASTRCTRPCCA